MTGEELFELTRNLSDRDLQVWAVTWVGVVGGRASMAKRPDIELACIEFIGRMHDLVGTPAPPRRTGN